MKKDEKYIPALNFNWLTPLYDPLVKWLMPESRFKRELVRQAHIQAKQRILDLGCGTATLTILIKKLHPDAEVFGLDGDSAILEIARRKAANAGSNISFHKSLSSQLPYAENSFDRVLTSMVLHHLTDTHKWRTLAECFRVLVPGGELHIVDFTTSNKLLTPRLREAGFKKVKEGAKYKTLFGELSLWQASV